MEVSSAEQALDQRRFVAQLLRARAAELGAMLAGRLLTAHPEMEHRYHPQACDKWAENYHSRLLDLAAAIDAGRAELFAKHAAWAGAAYESRGVPMADLVASFRVLDGELAGEMPAEDSALLHLYTAAAIEQLAAPCAAPVAGLDVGAPHGRLAATYLMAILEGDRLAASSVVLDAVRDGLSVRDAYDRVLLPVQLELGRMWHLNEINVAEEHFATTTTQSVMAQLQPYAVRKPANGRVVVAACVEGNSHEMAVRVVADYFEFAGWRAISLGANVPSEDIAVSARDFGVDVVALSAALSVQLVAVESAVALIRSIPGSRNPRIIVGGAGFQGYEDAWKQMGADGYAPDGDAAVALAERLVGLVR